MQIIYLFIYLVFRITSATAVIKQKLTESVLRRLSLFFAPLSLRHWRRQADQLAGDQQLLPPQQDGLSDDVWRRLQRLLGLLCQLPGNAGRAAWQHRLSSPHGQNRTSEHVGYDATPSLAQVGPLRPLNLEGEFPVYHDAHGSGGLWIMVTPSEKRSLISMGLSW